jgi:hypothetical protein
LRAAIATKQSILRAAFRNALLYAIGQMIEKGELPFTQDWHAWTFTTPAKFSVDVGRDRQNQREDLAVGSVTLTKIVNDMALKQGYDYTITPDKARPNSPSVQWSERCLGLALSLPRSWLPKVGLLREWFVTV